jgi:hypothetical protein
MRITEGQLRLIIRNALSSRKELLAEAFWERYDRLGAARRYRDVIVGPQNLSRLERDIVTIHWSLGGASDIKKMLANVRRSSITSTSAYHPGSAPLVSHRNRDELWGRVGLIIRGDWLMGFKDDAYTPGAMAGNEAYVELASYLKTYESRFFHKIIRSPDDVSVLASVASQTEVLVTNWIPTGLVILPPEDWQKAQIEAEHAEALSRGEESALLSDSPLAGFGDPDDPDWQSASSPDEMSEMVALAAQSGLPLYNENWEIIA